MAALRLHLLLGTALIAAGCAQQPVRPEHTSPPPAVSPATPAATDASIQAMKGAVAPSLLVFAHEQGFRQVVIKGNDYYFCKTEDPMGSIIPRRQCLDQTQLEGLRVTVEQQRQQLTQRSPEARQSAGP